MDATELSPTPDESRDKFIQEVRQADAPRRRTSYQTDSIPVDGVQSVPAAALAALDADIERAGDPFQESAVYKDSVGRTMFDSPPSEDNSITVLLPNAEIHKVPAQSLVRIKSREDGDGRIYLGVVVKGPFAEPDGLRADAPVIVTTNVRGAIFVPNYHGRVQVDLLGEELPSGAIEPPRFRPLPNSPVFLLNAADTARVLQTDGDLRLGLAAGHENLSVAVPLSKSVLPRHTGILGTTGGGKSTTVSGMIGQLQNQGVAVILIDTEGEYTEIDQPTEDPRMLERLQQLGRQAAGVDNTTLYHLVGRETANPGHPNRVSFSLRFSKLSPYALVEILDFSQAQEERFFKAYDLTKAMMERLGIFPRRGNPEDYEQAQDVDEFERGWPGMTLQHLYDIVAGLSLNADKDIAAWKPATSQFQPDQARAELQTLIKSTQVPGDVRSWRALQGKLGQLRRLRIFASREVEGLNFEQMIQPGRVSILDLSDTDSPKVNNLVIAELLRGVMDHQDAAYERATKRGEQPVPVVVFIEEAHEFLSTERIKRMEALFQQVARIARRGRKRWLGLVFITQLPQHLPDEVLGLINNWVLHKISDANVVARLKRSVGGVDDGLWQRLPSLAPGQAIISFGSLARPMLVAIDPTPAKLRMVD